MAIEKSIEREEKIDLGVEDQSNEIKLKVEEEQEDIGEGVLQEDGSVVFGAITEVSSEDLEFDSNLAEVIDDMELMLIASEIEEYFEEDRQSRQDWEKTYTDGLKYLGMKFDDERS
jgi:hypothetical protein